MADDAPTPAPPTPSEAAGAPANVSGSAASGSAEERAAVAGQEGARRQDRWWWRRRSVLALLGVIAVSWVAVAGLTAGFDTYSPIDEMQHADYVRRVLDGEVVASGNVLTFETMADLACRNVAPPFEERFPACGLDAYDPADFPHQGVNTAAIHPPTYYAIVGWLGQAASGVFDVEPVLTGARLASGVFLTLGTVLLWWLLAEFGISVLVRTGVGLALALTPLVLFQSATINPDSTALAAGAGLLLAVVLAERRRWPLWVPALVAGAGIALKSTNVIAVVAALAYLGVRWWQQRDDREVAVRLVWTAVWTAAGTLVVALAFSAYQRSIAVVPLSDLPMMEGMRAAAFPWDLLTRSITVTPTGTAWNPAQLSRPINNVIMTATAIGLAALAVAAVALAARGSRMRAVAVAGLVAVVATGPVFDVANYVLTTTYTPIPARYGLAAVPALAVAAAWVLDGRSIGRWAAAGVGGATALTSLAGVLAPLF